MAKQWKMKTERAGEGKEESDQRESSDQSGTKREKVIKMGESDQSGTENGR